MDPHSSADRPLRVALLGLGRVGGAVAERLVDPAWRADVESRGIVAPRLVAVGVHDPDRPRGVALPDAVRRSADLESLVVDDEIDVVVELIGGTEVAGPLVHRALAAGKHVVTANKQLLSVSGEALELAARAADAALRFEAAVAGGVPVLAPLVLDLAANRIESLRGIVNGTTNHILTQMLEDGREYADVLGEAQQRGYAEADASTDVEGHDAAHKLAILTRLAFGGWPATDAIRTAAPVVGREPQSGITGITRGELRRATDLGLVLKLVARVERDGAGGVRAAVTPMAVRAKSVIGTTGGVSNIVEVVGSPVGRVSFRGPGAGGPATSSAVLADLLAVCRGQGSTWGPLPPAVPLRMADDLGRARAWFFVLDTGDVADAAPLPGPIARLALVSSDGGVVTRPAELGELAPHLELLGRPVTIYPVLSDA